MATLLDFRRRIRSVKNTQQITRAMKFVAAARLRRAQEAALAARPYANELARLLRSIMARIDEPEHPLLAKRPEERILAIVLTGERGLAGAFNTNILRKANEFLRQRRDKKLSLIPVGKKGRDSLRRAGFKFAAEYVNVLAKVEFGTAREIARLASELYAQDEIDAVYLIFSEFKTVVTANLVVEKLLPVEPEKQTKSTDEKSGDYLAATAPMPLAAAWRDPGGDNSFEEFARAQIAGYDQRLDLAPAAADSLEYDYNSLVRHAKGATGIYLLALRLGEERFFELQKQLLADYAYRPLSLEEFGSRLEQAGVPGARGFLRAWGRGDASLGYRVGAVESDSGPAPTYTIQVERTGTIAVPVTVEARSARGDTARAVLPGRAEVDSARLHLGGRLEEVRIDPEGLLPMWSSDNLEMRRVFLRPMGAAGPPEPFLTLAAEPLRHDPDPHVVAAVVERLFETGRFERIEALIKDYPAARSCRDRVTCLAALPVARALLQRACDLQRSEEHTSELQSLA